MYNPGQYGLSVYGGSGVTDTGTIIDINMINAKRQNDNYIPVEISYFMNNLGSGASSLKFKTYDGTTLNTNMTVKNDGNVGIGNTQPNTKLSVNFTTATSDYTINSVSAFFGSGPANGGHGVMLGGEYSSGNSFIQSGYNNTLFGYDLILQPASGKVGIGITTPSEKLHVYGGNIKVDESKKVYFGNVWSIYGSNTDHLYFGLEGSTYGYVKALLQNGNFYDPSDDRLKHNEVIIQNALDTINLLVPIEYDMTKEFLEPDFVGDLDALNIEYTKQVGFIAQDVKNIPALSKYVSDGDDTNPYMLNYEKINIYAIKAIQELSQKNNQLETKVSTLETKNTELETKYNDLLARVTALENN